MKKASLIIFTDGIGFVLNKNSSPAWRNTNCNDKVKWSNHYFKGKLNF